MSSVAFSEPNQAHNCLTFNGKINQKKRLGEIYVFNFQSIKISTISPNCRMKIDIIYKPQLKIGTYTARGNTVDDIIPNLNPNTAGFYTNKNRRYNPIFTSSIPSTPKFTAFIEANDYTYLSYPILGEMIAIDLTPVDNNGDTIATDTDKQFHLYFNSILMNTSSELNENIF